MAKDVSKSSLVLATDGSVATLIAAAAAVAKVPNAVYKAIASFLADNEAAAVVAVPFEVDNAVLYNPYKFDSRAAAVEWAVAAAALSVSIEVSCPYSCVR